MKKSSEDLSRIQDDTDLRKSLLRSGKIRLTKEQPPPRPKQKDEEIKLEEGA